MGGSVTSLRSGVCVCVCLSRCTAVSFVFHRFCVHTCPLVGNQLEEHLLAISRRARAGIKGREPAEVSGVDGEQTSSWIQLPRAG